MDKLFWGFFLVFLNFRLNINEASLQLLPDWLGFTLLFLGCGELLKESELFQKPRPFCVGFAVYSGMLFLMDLWGIRITISWILSLVETCMNLYISMLVIDALTNVQMRRNYDLCAAHLRKVWKVMAVASIITYALLIVPALAVIGALVVAVVDIFFLIAVYDTRKAWQNMLHEQSKPF